MTHKRLRVILSGASGHMGRAIQETLTAQNHEVIYGLYRNNQFLSKESGLPKPLPTDYENIQSDALIDFSDPSNLTQVLAVALSLEIPLILGTTGYSNEDIAQIKEAARKIVIMKSAQMSLPFLHFQRYVGEMARTLPQDYDIEIIETHHRHKKDAPSGTALLLLHEIQKARPDAGWEHDRFATSRVKGSMIGISSIRSGEDMVGEHRVIFASKYERMEFLHRISSRVAYVVGLAEIVVWCQGQKAGLYNMEDM